jgi:hypothetical protein
MGKKKRKIGIGVDLAAGSDSGYAVATELNPDGSIEVLRAEPFLKAPKDNGGSVIPDWVRQYMDDRGVNSLTVVAPGRGAGKSSLLSTMARTPSTAKVHTWPSKPYWPAPPSPWPYGTIIKPTTMNPTIAEYSHHMVVNTRMPDQLITIDLRTRAGYTHLLLEDIEERWEVVEEAD